MTDINNIPASDISKNQDLVVAFDVLIAASTASNFSHATDENISKRNLVESEESILPVFPRPEGGRQNVLRTDAQKIAARLELMRLFKLIENIALPDQATGQRLQAPVEAHGNGIASSDASYPQLNSPSGAKIEPVQPGKIIKERLYDLRWNVSAAAKRLGVSRQHLFDVVNGKNGIRPEMAIRLEKGIGGTAEAWLGLQAAYDLAIARQADIQVCPLSLRKAPEP